jgi:hypothetical protein
VIVGRYQAVMYVFLKVERKLVHTVLQRLRDGLGSRIRFVELGKLPQSQGGKPCTKIRCVFAHKLLEAVNDLC